MRLSLYVRRMQQRKAFGSPHHERSPSSRIREFIIEPVIQYSDVNARVRFPGRFTIRAAVNRGASRADLEPRLVPQQGTLDIYRPKTGTQLHHT